MRLTIRDNEHEARVLSGQQLAELGLRIPRPHRVLVGRERDPGNYRAFGNVPLEKSARWVRFIFVVTNELEVMPLVIFVQLLVARPDVYPCPFSPVMLRLLRGPVEHGGA